jgi:acetylxylan esterase
LQRSTARFPGSSVEAIDYPAVLSPYGSSSYNGTLELTKRLKNYVDTCSKAKVVLMGYSQGAHVVGDVLCGGGANPNLGPDSPPIDAKYADKVEAVVQMGDPRFMLKKSFDVGTAMQGGVSSFSFYKKNIYILATRQFEVPVSCVQG